MEREGGRGFKESAHMIVGIGKSEIEIPAVVGVAALNPKAGWRQSSFFLRVLHCFL